MFENDGPNHYNNFIGMQTLNAEVNLKEILRWLAFFHSDDKYQTYLKHYLPMLPKEHFERLVGDVAVHGEDGAIDEKLTRARKDELTARWKDKYEPKEEKKPEPKKEEPKVDSRAEVKEVLKEEPKKAPKTK